MTALGFWTVFSLSIWFFKPAGAFLQPGLNAGRGGTWGAVHCRDDQYLSGNICCSNCPAGTHLLAPCSGAGRQGTCKECEDGTFTEHTNSLRQCLKCTQCRADQDVVRACSHTLNAECQCRPGRFCAPDQACEVCRKCSRCDEDEEVVRNCTPTANTECKKVQVKSASVKTAVIVLLSLLAAAVIVPALVCVWRRRRSTGSRGNPSDVLKAEKPHGDGPPAEEGRNGGRLIPTRPPVRAKPSVCVEDERTRLCESLDSSASNSQHSLTSPSACSSLPTPPATREDEAFPQLVAVNGERSLRECFHYFEEIDVDYHKRFFRLLGVRDNAIKGRDHLPYEDKIHDLLGDWIEKEGQEANLNRLLGALLDLNQRRTAENIKEKAVQQGHYICED